MKNIKKYEDFVNEEINLRTGLMGAALATSLMGGITSCNSEQEKYYKNLNQEVGKKQSFFLEKQAKGEYNVMLYNLDLYKSLNINDKKYNYTKSKLDNLLIKMMNSIDNEDEMSEIYNQLYKLRIENFINKNGICDEIKSKDQNVKIFYSPIDMESF